MRVVFMGTPDFAVPTLAALIENHEVVGVVTQPDKRKGRGKAMAFTPVKEKALEYDIPVYQPVKVGEEEFIETLRGLDPEVIVVAAFGQILPESILNMPKYGLTYMLPYFQSTVELPRFSGPSLMGKKKRV